MKRFVFPLEQIRSWNAMRLRLEEGDLEVVLERRQRAETAYSSVCSQKTEFEQLTLHQPLIDSTELARIEQFRTYVAAEARRLHAARAEFAKQIAVFRKRIIELRRRIEMLDRLRQRQQNTWTAEETKELQAAADEAFLQKLVANRMLSSQS